MNGDARRALNTLEMMADMAEVDDRGKRVLKPELLTEIAGERSTHFDNKGNRFHDLIPHCISRYVTCTDAALLLVCPSTRWWRSVVCRTSLFGDSV
ncbi:hypothetical protein ACNKHR_02110 [Shigella flexneri]